MTALLLLVLVAREREGLLLHLVAEGSCSSSWPEAAPEVVSSCVL
jgi:hypothetical protein